MVKQYMLLNKPLRFFPVYVIAVIFNAENKEIPVMFKYCSGITCKILRKDLNQVGGLYTGKKHNFYSYNLTNLRIDNV